jgi:hypothetical protein
MAGEERDDVLPESTLEVVVRSPEIQDAELIRLAPMSGAATSSRGGIELLADDIVNPAAVAHQLEEMRQDEQWMKVSCRYPLSSQSAIDVEYPGDSCCLLQDVAERSQQKSDMLQGYDDTVLRTEDLGGTTRKGPKALHHDPVEA